MLANVFENLRNRYLEIYELVSANSFKKTKVKLDLLTNIDMSLMVGKGIRGGICDPIYQYVKANNKCMKYYDKNKELSDIFNIGM